MLHTTPETLVKQHANAFKRSSRVCKSITETLSSLFERLRDNYADTIAHITRGKHNSCGDAANASPHAFETYAATIAPRSYDNHACR